MKFGCDAESSDRSVDYEAVELCCRRTTNESRLDDNTATTYIKFQNIFFDNFNWQANLN